MFSVYETDDVMQFREDTTTIVYAANIPVFSEEYENYICPGSHET